MNSIKLMVQQGSRSSDLDEAPVQSTPPQMQAAQFLASIVESSEDAIVSKDLNGTITSWNAAAQRLFGYTPEEAIGRPVQMLIPLDRQEEEPRILERIRRGERIDHYETIRRRKDGGLLDISLTVSPIKDATGRIIGASKIARDITDRKRDEERIRLLVREVDHRAKNLLALVQATVHLSHGATPADLKAAIEGRLRAIASAHSLFAQSRWIGANLKTLVSEELAAFSPNRGGRTFHEGPDVTLEPGAAQSFAVVLHELTTNAAKYGALSGPQGQVRVSWTEDSAGTLSFRWQERGGPVVTKPASRGFGTKVIEQLVRRQMGGEVVLDWDPAGVTCSITIATRRGLDPAAPDGTP
jgi:PAS domain S-box-containing protein